jgi:hypothetical protein
MNPSPPRIFQVLFPPVTTCRSHGKVILFSISLPWGIVVPRIGIIGRQKCPAKLLNLPFFKLVCLYDVRIVLLCTSTSWRPVRVVGCRGERRSIHGRCRQLVMCSLKIRMLWNMRSLMGSSFTSRCWSQHRLWRLLKSLKVAGKRDGTANRENTLLLICIYQSSNF